jgi:hypothetical protein
MAESKQFLDETNIQLGKELWLIHSSLAVYRVIGLNAGTIRVRPGHGFFGFVQNQTLSAVALGLGKVFEREQPNGYELCSVGGVFRLAKAVKIQDSSAAAEFVMRYGVTPSSDWIRDVDQVFSVQRSWILGHMRVIDRVRNTRLAHIQQMAPEGNLPSVAAFEELLTFAFNFHSFINEAFLSVHSHPTLNDEQVETGLLRVLEMIGVTDPPSHFTDI